DERDVVLLAQDARVFLHLLRLQDRRGARAAHHHPRPLDPLVLRDPFMVQPLRELDDVGCVEVNNSNADHCAFPLKCSTQRREEGGCGDEWGSGDWVSTTAIPISPLTPTSPFSCPPTKISHAAAADARVGLRRRS